MKFRTKKVKAVKKVVPVEAPVEEVKKPSERVFLTRYMRLHPDRRA